MKDKKRFQEIKKLDDKEMSGFSKHFTDPNIEEVPTKEFPEFLTQSQVLRNSTLGVIHASGAVVAGVAENSRMATTLYRHDFKEEAKGGSPINVDKYYITDDEPRRLLKLKPDFEGHKLGSLPKELKKLTK